MSQYMGLVHQLVLTKMERGELSIESVEDLKNVLKEYEIHTKVIEEQLEMCKKDHADLRMEMSRLMNENHDLYRRLKMATETALEKTDLSALQSSEAIDNLQQQLESALAEKDTVEKLWKSSILEVDALKETLNEFQTGKKVQKDYTEAIHILEQKQSVLKSENDQLNGKCKFLEDQMKEVNLQMNAANEKNCALKRSLRESTEQEQLWKSKFLALEASFIELDRAYQTDKVKYAQVREYEKAESSLRQKLEDSQRNGKELQMALEQCHEHKQDLLRKIAVDRKTVADALTLVEEANRNTEEAVAREKAATEDAKKLRAEWDKLVDEAGRRVASEEANLRKQFDEQLAVVKHQLEVVEQERNRKRVEVEQMQQECKRLETLVAESQTVGSDQLEKLSRKLSSAETNCEELHQENAVLREALDKLEDKCQRKSQQRQKLESEIRRLKEDTQFYQQELLMSEQKADILNSQLHATSLDLAQLQSHTILHRGNSGEMEAKVSLSSTLELIKKLNENYGHMNDKWKNEMYLLTDKLEEKLKKSKKKNKVHFNKEQSEGKQ
ncbi:sodium channel and clathrin linker 1-like isoform X2 [Macrosteles quadrilineatus]|uniref:sodium channel and clathrin linker 1-like isoform X2 n=1 Tax=Macrosteles quadrilineatus TaxID=74068 RepID=UPI0023E21951|nr:sodium channel and clathrin linker 1-like isoform X2 [Macrosteles quadrilineatus]